MRKCPKCGEQYADTDFRTLCSNCMVSLEQASSTAPAAVAPAGPIQVGGPESALSAPAPIIPTTITMPEIVVPEMTVPPGSGIAMPAPPAAPEETPPELEIVLEPEDAPKPGPYRPPLTPQPNPAVPQPPFLPMPEREPELEPSVPAPAPAPRRTPQPVPTPEPGEPAPSARLGDVLKPDELNSNRSAFGVYLFFGFVTGTICFLLLPHLDNPFNLFLLAGLGWLTYYLFRQALYRSAVSAVAVAPTRRLRLGDPVPLHAIISVVRDLAVTDAEITLIGEERAVRGEGKGSTTYRNTFYEKKVRIPTPPSWTGGHKMLLDASVPMPASAPASFIGRKNHIEWSATLWVGITGMPDVRQRVPLTIIPFCEGAPQPNARPVYHLPELNPLNAQIGFTCPLSSGNLPVFEVGKAIPFSLRMRPEGDFAQQRVFVELMYLVSGSGDPENQVVARQSFSVAYWQGDPDHVEDSLLTVPPGSPVTYDGTHVRIHWAVAIRHEQPWGRDRRQVFEVLVVPANEQ
ncbi:MAG: hypothetical protein ACYC6A_12840 [Armatimonadota bacterium]